MMLMSSHTDFPRSLSRIQKTGMSTVIGMFVEASRHIRSGHRRVIVRLPPVTWLSTMASSTVSSVGLTVKPSRMMTTQSVSEGCPGGAGVADAAPSPDPRDIKLFQVM